MTDGPGDYTGNEYCRFKALRPLRLSTLEFSVEENWDYLKVAGVAYDSGYPPPQGLALKKGSQVNWRTDDSRQYAGFKVCVDDGKNTNVTGNYG